ncbi:MAG: TlyA family RNA methyltransferase [Pseudomonadota bacterium]
MRLDLYLVHEKLARSRERAKDAIQAGDVQVNGKVVKKPAYDTADTDEVTMTPGEGDYVSRGAYKLLEGLKAFGVTPAGKICLDLGASTGGFTQVLKEAGAEKIYAVDVGRDQLALELRHDPKILSLEQTHAKDLTADLIPEPIELLVCDVSFISLMKALPPALALTASAAQLVALVKPQFELGRENLGKGGLVALPVEDQRAWAEETLLPWLQAQGWRVLGLVDSPIKGGDGNHEFLLGAIRHVSPSL